MDELRKRMREIHDEVAPDYYDKSMQENLFQKFWHTRRIDVISSLIKGEGATLLDIGCGGGTILDLITSRSPVKFSAGVDAARLPIEYAHKHHAGPHYLKADFYELPFKDRSFEIVTAIEVLEHLQDPDKAIQEAKRCLKESGKLIILVPNENNILFRFIWFFWTMGKGKIWKHAHLQQFTAKSLKSLLEQEGFKVSETRMFILGMLMAMKAIVSRS